MGTFSKRVIAVCIVLVLLGVGVFAFVKLRKVETVSTPVVVLQPKESGTKHAVIGTSVEGRSIEAFTFGSGATHLVFVGGIHGGYEWNSVLLSYQFIDYLSQNPGALPASLTVSVIPSANPDGVFKVIGKVGRFVLADVPTTTPQTTPGLGRFNAHDIDLNRNFDCNWKPTSTWREKTVSAGTQAFSEPEAKALRDFVLKDKPVGVVFWHSQSNAVYASECNAGILPRTLDIMNVYSKASGYPAVKSFDAYSITGDAEGWLASINIPAITVELSTHGTVEWERNLAGAKALFEYYRNLK
ncbi:MAG: M14 family metallopeptidase [Candidatus Taylorbacteria bacterium]